MSIVKMKRFRLIALEEDRDTLFQRLMHIGCVEISQSDEKLADPAWAALLKRGSAPLTGLREQANSVKTALEGLDQYAPVKTGLFKTRESIQEGEFLSSAALEAALKTADDINSHLREINLLFGQEDHLKALKANLQPWTAMALPLETRSTENIAIFFGVCPAEVHVDELKNALTAEAPTSELYLSHTDRDQHYMVFVCHKSEEQIAEEILRQRAFSQVSFPELTGTAIDNISSIEAKCKEIASQREAHISQVASYQESRRALKICADRLTQEISKAAAQENLLTNGTIFFAEGWVPLPSEEAFADVLAPFVHACETRDPEEGDKVPTLLKNSKLVSSVNVVTEMYSLPAYGSIDPNPLMFPFYVIFFGMMFADMAYGLLLFFGSWIIIKKYKPKGTFGNLLQLARVCGVTTFIWGAISCSFFSDLISVIAESFFGISDFQLYQPIVNPINDPLPVLYLSLVLGGIQIIFGMGIKAYMLIRDGHFWDAVFDVGSWWVLFAGIGVAFLTGNFIVLLIGIAMLILTQGRHSKSIVGKIVGGIGSLYDITSYLSDILSYARLMSLMLASSVIGSLVNVLGTLPGNIFIFLIIFVIGHAFNIGINVIGTYVHSARLQYLEFFNKFYVGGGIPFRPLAYQTKYVDIIKEEQ